MRLSAQSAQCIVDEIGGIVGQNINMMDERGYIIASTDAARLGHFHEGAKRIIDENLPEYYVTPETATESVRPGLNLPIRHEGMTVGVIGITGDYDQVVSYGQVVKKMTEILIREGTEQDEQRLGLRVRSRFLEDWVLGSGMLQAQALAERGLALGIDIALPRRVMIVSPYDLDHYINTAEGQKQLELLEMAVSGLVEREAGNIILRNAARQILLVRKRPNEEMQALAERLSRMAFASFHVRLAVGIDGDITDIHQAYMQANRSWQASRRLSGGIFFYNRVTLELFVGDIPRRTKEEYLHKVFPNCGYEELLRWMGLLEAYFAAEGSLQRAADTLYLHKNTLQYRLRRLREISGYDVRLPSHAAVFYMALLFFREMQATPLFWESGDLEK